MRNILLGSVVMCTAFALSKPWMFYTQVTVGLLIMISGVISGALTIVRDYRECKREIEFEAKKAEMIRRRALGEEQ